MFVRKPSCQALAQGICKPLHITTTVLAQSEHLRNVRGLSAIWHQKARTLYGMPDTHPDVSCGGQTGKSQVPETPIVYSFSSLSNQGTDITSLVCHIRPPTTLSTSRTHHLTSRVTRRRLTNEASWPTFPSLFTGRLLSLPFSAVVVPWDGLAVKARLQPIASIS